jgi:PRTRC genetic system protein E
MFKELLPILRHRAVLLTMTFEEHDQIRVVVVPKKTKDGNDEALTTPLSVTGTPEELDADLASTLVSFVGSHLQLKNTLEQAKATMDAAAKTAQAEARSKSKTLAKKEDTAATSAKPREAAKPAEPIKPTAPKTASLFDTAPAAQPTTTPSATPEEVDEEEEILHEVEDEDEQVAVNGDELEDAA